MKEKKISIAVIEINTHAEVLQNFLNILGDLPFIINLYVVEKVWKRVRLKSNLETQPTVNIIKSPMYVNSFFKQKINEINTNDLIFINTLETHFFIFSKLKFKPPVVCRVHNSNTFFNPTRNLYFRPELNFIIKDIIYILKRQLLNLDILYRPRFIKKVNYFCFPDDVILNHAIENGYVTRSNIIEPIPTIFKTNTIEPITLKKTSINIAVIGSIDKRRRNYSDLFRAFKSLLPEIELSQKINLYLLGKPFGSYGKTIVKKFRKLETVNFKLYGYKTFVPYDEFKMILQKTDFLIIPINKFAKYKIFREIYGLTKISGNINDMILYEIPALIPEYYPLDEKLNPLTLHYSGAEGLSEKLNYWISTQKYKKILVGDSLAYYELKKIKKEVYNILKETLFSNDE